jgi:hypothetical protein
MEQQWVRTGIKEVIIYLFIGIFVFIILPVVGGFILRGFQESFQSNVIEISSYLGSYLIYVFLGIGSLFLIIFPIANLLTIRKGEHPATQENPNWFRIFTVSYIFNPEDGALWQLSKYFNEKKNIMKWSLNILRVFVVAIIIFGIVGFLQLSFPQMNISGVPAGQIPQQITTTSDIIFGAGIPSFTENGILDFIMFFLLGINAYLCAKFIKDKKMKLAIFFVIALLIIAPLMGLVWMSFHNIVYGSSEASLQATFIFGWVGATITILTGIFFFWFVWHFFNNMIIKLLELVTVQEDIKLVLGISLILLILVWISIEYLVIKASKKKNIGQL